MGTAEQKISFYIGLHGQQTGPYSYAEMARFIRKGNLDPASVINVGGESDWLPLGRTPELADLLSSVASGASHLSVVDSTLSAEAKSPSRWLLAAGALVLTAVVAYLSMHKH